VKVEEGQAVVEQPFSIEDRAQNLAQGILAQEEGAPRDEKGKFTKPAAPEAAEAPEATEEAQEPAEEAEAPETPEVDWESLKGLKRRLKVKAEDGSDEEVELSLEEMEKGVMLERSYRQKTAQIARERESLQQKVRETIEPKLKEYDDKLQIAEQVIWHTLAPELQSTDWNKLAQENPAEWAQKYQKVQNINGKLAAIQAERRKIAEANAQEAQAKAMKAAEEAVETLRTEIPGWNDELYGRILRTSIEQFGFKAEEVNAITDPRAIKVLHDAMKYRALQAKPVVEKRTPAPVPKVVKPGTAEKGNAGADKWKEGMAKLRKSGRTEDAVELAKILLANEGKK